MTATLIKKVLEQQMKQSLVMEMLILRRLERGGGGRSSVGRC